MGIESISSPADLKNHLPDNQPKIVVLPKGESKLCIVSWVPDKTPRGLKMKFSMYTPPVLDMIKELTSSELTRAEATRPSDLTDDLLNGSAPKKRGMCGSLSRIGGFKLPMIN